MTIDTIIKSAGFRLTRTNKHKVWKRNDGKTLVTASTPSDRRHEHNVISTLSRITGIRKHDLLDTRRIRRKAETQISAPRPESQLVIQPVIQPVVSQPVALVESVTLAPAPAPLTRAERNFLKRLEKHAEQRRLRDEKTVRILQGLFQDAAMLQEYLGELDNNHDHHVGYAIHLYELCKDHGYNTNIMIADIAINHTDAGVVQLIVRVNGRWYLDIVHKQVRTTPKWTIECTEGQAIVECMAALNVSIEAGEYVLSE